MSHSLVINGRGSGKTTRAILEAPQGALFVCPSADFARSYASDLARKLGRPDVKFIGPFMVIEAWRGTDRLVVVDHAAKLDPRVAAEIDHHNAAVRLRHARAA